MNRSRLFKLQRAGLFDTEKEWAGLADYPLFYPDYKRAMWNCVKRTGRKRYIGVKRETKRANELLTRLTIRPYAPLIRPPDEMPKTAHHVRDGRRVETLSLA